jgi:hypothetical protein
MRTFVVSPSRFTFRDDQLIAHFRDTRLAYYLGEHVPGTGTAPARYAPWAVDPARLAAAVDRWLEM